MSYKLGITLFLFVATIFMLSSCKDDEPTLEEGNLEIQFIATYDGEPLIMNNSYLYGFGQEIKINVAQFFISDLEIEGSEQIRLEEIRDLNFTETNQTDDGANQGIRITYQGVPVGNYNSMEWGVGVRQDLNSMEPSDFEPGHPLRNESSYWTAWNSYIFSKLEGKVDTLSGAFDLIFIYHSGKDELYQEVEKSVSIEVKGGETTVLVFEIDHRDLLFRGNDALDIKAKPTAHSAGDLEYPRYLLENFAQASHISIR